MGQAARAGLCRQHAHTSLCAGYGAQGIAPDNRRADETPSVARTRIARSPGAHSFGQSTTGIDFQLYFMIMYLYDSIRLSKGQRRAEIGTEAGASIQADGSYVSSPQPSALGARRNRRALLLWATWRRAGRRQRPIPGPASAAARESRRMATYFNHHPAG